MPREAIPNKRVAVAGSGIVTVKMPVLSEKL